MKSSSLTLACLSLCSLLLVPITRATAAEACKCSATDKSFFMKASQGGMTEVEAGKLAQEKASSQGVKDFGAKMVQDHSANDADLMALAKTKDVTVSDKLDASHQAMIDKMSKLSGDAFDKAYVKDQVDGHKKMLKLMKSEESSKDADLKDFSTKTADTVKMHLTMAQDLQKTVK
jgi:putative membrane protein